MERRERDLFHLDAIKVNSAVYEEPRGSGSIEISRNMGTRDAMSVELRRKEA